MWAFWRTKVRESWSLREAIAGRGTFLTSVWPGCVWWEPSSLLADSFNKCCCHIDWGMRRVASGVGLFCGDSPLSCILLASCSGLLICLIPHFLPGIPASLLRSSYLPTFPLTRPALAKLADLLAFPLPVLCGGFSMILPRNPCVLGSHGRFVMSCWAHGMVFFVGSSRCCRLSLAWWQAGVWLSGGGGVCSFLGAEQLEAGRSTKRVIWLFYWYPGGRHIFSIICRHCSRAVLVTSEAFNFFFSFEFGHIDCS